MAPRREWGLKQKLNAAATQAEESDEELQELLNHYDYVPEKRRADGALRNIKMQFPDTPYGKLMFEVIKTAIYDLFAHYPEDTVSAVRYLSGDIVHAKLCDVNPEWIRTELKRAHVYLNARSGILR